MLGPVFFIQFPAVAASLNINHSCPVMSMTHRIITIFHHYTCVLRLRDVLGLRIGLGVRSKTLP